MKLARPEDLEALKTPKGGWNARTLKALGVPWPPKTGWLRDIKRRIRHGEIIEVDLPTLPECRWEFIQVTGHWWTECQEACEYQDNDFKFCPYCGKRIKGKSA